MTYFKIALGAAIIAIAGAVVAHQQTSAASPRARSVRAPSLCAGFTMRLQPGAFRPDGSPWPGWPVARDMPLDGVTAQVPLYPGAISSHAKLAKGIFFDIIASKYLKMAVAEFSLPSGAGRALQWYRKSFDACGFTSREGGTDAMVFDSPTTASLRVGVALQPVSSHSSLVLYFASAESFPPRPIRSFVDPPTAGRLTSATITYRAPPAGRSLRMKLTNPRAIQALVDTIDRPKDVAPDYLATCSTEELATPTIVFRYRGGRRDRVVVSPDCFSFRVNGSRPIQDDNRAIWSYVGYLVYKHCLEYRCAP